MGLFGKKDTRTQEQIIKDNIEFYKQKYGLQDMDEKTLELVRQINDELIGTGLMKAGMTLSFGNTEDKVKVAYLSAIFQQNWMIIRELNKLNNNIESLKTSK